MLLLIGYPFCLLFSQIGGDGTYRFLDLTNSAKVAALGGTQIAFTDNDLDLTFYNPSLLSDSMRNQLSINYVSYIAGIGVGYAAFSPNLRGPDAFAFGIHYVNYGTFDGATETGQLTNTSINSPTGNSRRIRFRSSAKGEMKAAKTTKPLSKNNRA